MSYRAEIDRMLRTMPSDWKRQWALARQELRRLDYDPPAQPDASDVLQALYLTAGGRESGDKVVGSVPVPAAVREEAMRAVRMAHKHNYGAWHMIGLARAVQLATVPRIDTRSVERMRAFFTRHAKDARAPHFGDDTRPSRGYLAHLVWGGDPAKEWVMGMERKMRRNPLAKPTADMGFSIRRDAIPGVVEVYVYDLNDLAHPERAMVAGAMLVPKEHDGAVRWEATGMAACPGYGPLIYDLAAAVLGQRLHPTNDQSNAAKAFWSKQPHTYIDPLPPEAFAGKYGITVRDLYAQGADLTPEELQRMSDELTTVFFAAREAEAAGKPAALARCRPNRRQR
jgi:hypothetical protein